MIICSLQLTAYRLSSAESNGTGVNSCNSAGDLANLNLISGYLPT